jgi:hypothetical protein
VLRERGKSKPDYVIAHRPTMTKRKNDDSPLMSAEELARRMLAMPVKTREEMTKKKAKPRRKK